MNNIDARLQDAKELLSNSDKPYAVISLKKWVDDVDILKDKIAELEKALEPFAELDVSPNISASINSGIGYRDLPVLCIDRTCIYLQDFINARKLMGNNHGRR